MDWQITVVLVLVGAALLYILRATWRTWLGGRSGCGGKCGCGAKKNPATTGQSGKTVAYIPLENLKLRQRNGTEF